MSLAFSFFPEDYLDKLETSSYLRTISDTFFKPDVACIYVFVDLPAGMDEKTFLRHCHLKVNYSPHLINSNKSWATHLIESC